jgi:hypothetical protein
MLSQEPNFAPDAIAEVARTFGQLTKTPNKAPHLPDHKAARE